LHRHWKKPKKVIIRKEVPAGRDAKIHVVVADNRSHAII